MKYRLVVAAALSARKTLPTLKMHLAKAQAIDAKL